jgi:hypothetical protein
MQVLLAGVRGYFWDFDRVTPFPVPSLLKNLPEDGAEEHDLADHAYVNAEANAAAGAGHMSLGAVAGPTVTSGELSDNPMEGDTVGDGPGHPLADSSLQDTDNALHTEAVGVVQPSMGTLKHTHMSGRHPFVKQESMNAGDSFMSAYSNLDHMGSLESASSSLNCSGGGCKEAGVAPVAELQHTHSPESNSIPALQETAPRIVRGVFGGISGDSGAICLPYPP